MFERGAIRNAGHRQQIADFTRLRWGKITPTDIDGFLEFDNRLFVHFEGKHGMAPVPYGQRLALQRQCDNLHKPPEKMAVAFVVEHRDSGLIDYYAATVREYRWQFAWQLPKQKVNLFDAIDWFHAKVFGRPVAPKLLVSGPQAPLTDSGRYEPSPAEDLSKHSEWLEDYERFERS